MLRSYPLFGETWNGKCSLYVILSALRQMPDFKKACNRAQKKDQVCKPRYGICQSWDGRGSEKADYRSQGGTCQTLERYGTEMFDNASRQHTKVWRGIQSR